MKPKDRARQYTVSTSAIYLLHKSTSLLFSSLSSPHQSPIYFDNVYFRTYRYFLTPGSFPLQSPRASANSLPLSLQAAYKHYLRAISLWPKDPLRPEVQFRDALRRRAERRFLPAPPSSASSPSKNSQPSSSVAKSTPTVILDEAAELEQVNALYGLLEGRYESKVCALRTLPHFAFFYILQSIKKGERVEKKEENCVERGGLV